MFEFSLGICLSKLIIINLDSQYSCSNIDIILLIKSPKMTILAPNRQYQHNYSYCFLVLLS